VPWSTRSRGSALPRLQSKSFDAPDETRVLPRALARIVNLDEATVGHAVWEPGWRWTTDMQPIIGTQLCEHHHLGYAISGTLAVKTMAGEELEINGGSVYEIPPGHDAWVVGDGPFVTIDWASSRIVGLPPEDPGERVLGTVLFTDIVGSTATLERVGDIAWREMLFRHNARMREVINTHHGREVGTTGDGFLCEFDGATRAVRCGAAMVRAAEVLGVQIRVGIHTGEIEFIAGYVRGVPVHAAARVLALAGPSDVRLSETTRALSEGSGLALEDMGEHALKGLSGERRLYRLLS
jgi:class 3 adenylate cyclase